MRAVQELLGHTDIATTQIYTHVGQDALEKAHAAYHPRGKEGDSDGNGAASNEN